MYGTPVALETPERFRPSPWESYSYDANDNAGRTPSVTGAQNVPEAHRNTPASAEVDALGRVVTQVARLPDKALTTRTEYDLRGNVTAIIDPVGRRAFENFYDLANRALRTESIDAGQKRFVFDAAGNGIERRDAKSALTLTTYDAQNQPATLWARDDAEAAVTLRQRIEYGDAALGEADARDRNLLGKPWRAWDEAGRVDTERVDFKGNILESVRRVISDETLEADREWRPDWLRDGEGVFEDREYLQSARFDALNRVVEQRMPVDVEGRRRVVEPRYNRAGALEGVSVDGRAIVERIAYDAKGQRTLEVHGNGVLVRWAYDPETFRLVRQRAERCESIDGGYRPEGAPLRDTAHAYDLVGNIVAIHERSPDSGVDHADELDRVFAYDALYRLTFATGREADVQLPTPWDPAPKNDAKATRPYTEAYEFDDAGNLVRLKHVRKDGDGGTWVRELEPETASNRLQSMTVGESVFKYRFDPAGNMRSETESRRMFWDHADRMKAFATDDGSSESLRAQYLYGADGMRVKKFVQPSSGQSRSTTYLGEAFEARRHGDRRNDELHVGPIRRVLGECFDDDPRAGDELQAQWELMDHLASVTVCTNTSGDWTNVEEFTPFGETSFGGFASKRFRFTGKERDEESGVGYHAARYLASWLGRWTSSDPSGPADGLNAFSYARASPLMRVDPNGMESAPANLGPARDATTKESGVGETPAERYLRGEAEADARGGSTDAANYVYAGKEGSITVSGSQGFLEKFFLFAQTETGSTLIKRITDAGGNVTIYEDPDGPSGYFMRLHATPEDAVGQALPPSGEGTERSQETYLFTGNYREQMPDEAKRMNEPESSGRRGHRHTLGEFFAHELGHVLGSIDAPKGLDSPGQFMGLSADAALLWGRAFRAELGQDPLEHDHFGDLKRSDSNQEGGMVFRGLSKPPRRESPGIPDVDRYRERFRPILFETPQPSR